MEYIKNHFHENKIQWIVMIASFFLLFTLFNDNLLSSIRLFLSWVAAALSYKIFIEDLTIDRLKDKQLSPKKAIYNIAEKSRNIFYDKLLKR